MTISEEPEFIQGDSGASDTYPIQAGGIKKNAHAMLKGHPCKVVEYTTSKTGKHGHAKAHIVGLDIFTGRKFEDICPTSHNIEVPHIKRAEFLILDVTEDGFVHLLTENGETKNDLQLPRDTDGKPTTLGNTIKGQFEDGKSLLATVLAACGQEKIVACKEVST